MKKFSKLIVLACGLLFVIMATTRQSRLAKQAINKEVAALNEELGGESYDGKVETGTVALDTAIIREAQKRIASLNLYKAFFEDAPIGLLVKEKFQDCNCFRVVAFNKAWEKIVLEPSGINPQTYMYSSDFDLWPDSLATLYDSQDNYAVDNNAVSEFSAPIPYKKTTKDADFVKYSDGKKRLYLIYLSTKTWDEL